jgi:cytochrome c553
LAGQKPEYFIAAMEAYARGWRASGIMEPIAAGLSAQATAELARYYAAAANKATAGVSSVRSAMQVPGLNSGSANPGMMPTAQAGSEPTNSSNPNAADRQSAIERGRKIALNGIPQQRVPACAECHGPAEIRRNPHYPILAGQYADYLLLQLMLFKNHARGGSAYAHLMQPVASGITTQQMRDVALFYESLKTE